MPQLYDDLSKDLYHDLMQDFTGKPAARDHRSSAVGKLRDMKKEKNGPGIANLQRTLLQRRAEINGATRNFIFGQRNDPRDGPNTRATFISSNLNYNNNNEDDDDSDGDDDDSDGDDDDNFNDNDIIDDRVSSSPSSLLLCCGLC